MAKPQRVHWLQHDPQEGSGCIAAWLRARSLKVTHTRLYAGERLPKASAFDWLIAMGGPMNIYEHDRHPWLVAEKDLINDACVNKKVLGICLGGQLLSDVLGGAVTRNRQPEVGWFDVTLTKEADQCRAFENFPRRFEGFHWHVDRFSLPSGCRTLMKSDACVNQAFHKEQRLVGTQFHMEVRLSDARRWLKQDAPRPARYVQSARHILGRPARFAALNRLMRQVLDNMHAL